MWFLLYISLYLNILHIFFLLFTIDVLVSNIFNCISLVLFEFSKWNKYFFSNTKCSRSGSRIADRTRPKGLELSIMARLLLRRFPHLQPGRFSMAAHRHDRRRICRCVLLRFRGGIEIDHSYGLRYRGLCCHSRHSTHGTGRRGRMRPRDGRLHSCWAESGSTNHYSANLIVVNFCTICLCHVLDPLNLAISLVDVTVRYIARNMLNWYKHHPVL